MHLWLRWLFERAWIPVGALFAALAVTLATLRTVFVPTQEIWYIVPLLQHGMEFGLLHPSTLSLQVMEHFIAVPMALIVLPYALLGVLPPLSPANLTYVNVLNVGCSLFTIGLLLLLIRRSIGHSKLEFSFVAIAALCVGLAPSQWELWTVPSIALTLSTLLTVAAVALITSLRPSFTTVLCTGILCLLATFTFASGMLSWLVVLPCIACLSASRAWKAKIIAAWLFLGLLACTFVLSRLDPIPHRIAFSLPTFLGNTFALLAFPFAPHSRSQPLSYPVLVFLGAVMCLVLLLNLRAGMKRDKALSIQAGSLFLFSMLQAVCIAVSRAQPLESRYLGLVFPGAVLLLALLARTLSLRSMPVQALLVSVVLACGVQSLQAVRPLEGRFNTFQHASACLETYDIAEDSCLAPLYFGHGGFVREYAHMLNQLGFLHQFVPNTNAQWFYDPHPEYGYVENVSRSGSMLTFWGWAREGDCGARHVILTADSHQIVAHTRSVLRREGMHGGMLCGSRFGWAVDVRASAFSVGAQPKAWVYDEANRSFYALASTDGYAIAEAAALQ